jgi:DNA-binding PadR family transcriptional regulator
VDFPALREPTFFILSALAGGPLHGYGIIGEVERLSGGRLRLRAGTLYGALDRLSSDGWVAFDGVSQESGPQRTNYRLTDEGRVRLEAEVARLEASVRAVRKQLRATHA